MRLAVVLILLLGLIESQASERADAGWAATGIGYKNIFYLVNNKSCSVSSQRFLGCVTVINYLLQASQTPQRMTTYTHENIEDKNITAHFGSIKIVNGPLSDEELLNPVKTQELWKNVFYNRNNIGDFTEVMFFATSLIKDKAKEPEVAAAAINIFFKIVYDPHTEILTKKKWSEVTAAEDTVFGFYLRPVQSGLKVVNVIPDSPADKAGIRILDVIYKINDLELSQTENMDKALGSILKGINKLVVYVDRDGTKKTFQIERAKVILPDVQLSYHYGVTKSDYIAFLKINSFLSDDVCLKFKEKLTAVVKDKNVTRLVIDLRDNGGGAVNSAVCIASIFLGPNKPLFQLRELDADQALPNSETVTEESEIRYDKKFIILQNFLSASASELFSGAMREYERAYIVGSRSFGKGTAQILVDMTDKSNELLNVLLRMPDFNELANLNEIYIKFTLGRFHLPSGRTNQIFGVPVDFEAYSNLEPTEYEKNPLREESLFGNRVQGGLGFQSFKPMSDEAAVRACIKASDWALKNYAYYGEYDIAKAIEVASCLKN
jgi:carboxyl-terminal processing protease